ncbi:hypothetical protein B0H14DRAFT_3514007 [Mycena olivaceomarginata]|nr:hypothetical protein B0H14DRAFT_3514007 [Mycena olivaceomarginata]
MSSSSSAPRPTAGNATASSSRHHIQTVGQRARARLSNAQHLRLITLARFPEPPVFPPAFKHLPPPPPPRLPMEQPENGRGILAIIWMANRVSPKKVSLAPPEAGFVWLDQADNVLRLGGAKIAAPMALEIFLGRRWKPVTWDAPIPARSGTALLLHADQYNGWDGKMFVRDALATQRPFDKTTSPPTDLSHLHILVPTHLRTRQPHPFCPQRNPSEPTIARFTVGDHNGFHTAYIEFCDCRRPGDYARWQQLIAVRLFPATFEQPQTAFTFTAMKQFHVHSLASKKSAYDYVRALCQLSNNAAPDTIADRYREFLFACRIWRYLTLERRTGQAQAHGIDQFVPHQRAGSLALRCPACPEVGFNVTLEEMENTKEEDRHKMTGFYSGDANFKMQRSNKVDDPDDFALNNGRAYIPPNEDFKAYVKLIKKEKPEELAECDHLNAARMQRISKFKNTVVMGVAAIQCARHGFYMPQSIVDLDLGEGYAYTDYALCYALSDMQLLRWIRFGYDIWCQYGVRLMERITRWFPSMVAVFEKVVGAINKLHVLSHKELCQIIHNLNWLLYVGMVTMEMIETGWAEQNLTAGSTREMNAGHRHDVIDGTSDHWNWKKTIKLPSALSRLYRVAKSEERARTASFSEIDKFQREQHKEAVLEWEKKDENPRRNNKGVWHSVFQVNMKSGPPTHAAAFTKLLAKEAAAAAAEAERHKTGDVGLISAALMAERHRERLKRMNASPNTAPEAKLAAKQQLDSDIQALRKLQLDRVPEPHKYMPPMDSDEPQKMRLCLPSDFCAADCERLKLTELAAVEYALRKGQAHDALGELRTAIRTNNFNTGMKMTDIYGTGATTRAGNFLKSLANNVQQAGDTYRRLWRGLRALGLPKDDPTLQPLGWKEQWGKGSKALKSTRSKDREPWFWSAQRPSGLDDKGVVAWEKEMDRVQWFRERALMKRAKEEIEILEEEFKRAKRWFTQTSEIWTKMAGMEKRGDYHDDQGWRAYAYRQAAIYEDLAHQSKAEWVKLPQLIAQDAIAEANKAKEDEEERERDSREEPDYKEDYLVVVE